MTEKREARVAVQDIPGGDAFYVDLAGRQSLRLTIDVLVPDNTTWGALNAVVGTQGTLAVSGLDTHNAVLMSVSRPAPLPGGQITGTAEWLITDP